MTCKALFEKFSEKSIKGLMMAQREALVYGEEHVDPPYLFLGLVATDCMNSRRGFMGTGLELTQARAAVEGVTGCVMKHKNMGTYGNLPFSEESRSILRKACVLAQNQRYVTPEHLFLALEDHEVVSKVIGVLESPPGILKKTASERTNEAAAPPPKKKLETLDTYCTDLCELAEKGRIDPLIGRQKEIDRMIQILARRRKNNPVLIGEPGVGKTAVVEGLARRIVDGHESVPPFLAHMRILSLDMGAIIAGTKERGGFESRLTKIVAELKESRQRSILFIDEIHTIVRAGSSEDGMSAANILKPALARGEIQCIGATTIDEHRKYIESDAALERRMQPILLREPDLQETRDILQGLCDRYEAHHACMYSPEALDRIIELCGLVGDRKMPDKAIDMMDEVGSYVRVRSSTGVDKGLVRRVRDRYQMIRQQRFEELAADGRLTLPPVTPQDVDIIAEGLSGIRVTPDATLEAMRGFLGSRIAGQEHAIDAVTRAMTRSQAGMRDRTRPVANFLFVGPSGVGKTELAKVMAECYCRGNMIRFDMSEMMEPHSVAKLIGSPPGYVGYGEGGGLTDAIRTKPQSVVLLDEIEKAHPQVHNVLLQIMEDGRLTDSKGRVVSFSDAIVVLTSNVGSSHHQNNKSFFSNDNDNGQNEDDTRMAVKRAFRPEFVNRLDDIVVFQPLGREELDRIMFDRVSDLIRDAHEKHGVRLRVSPHTMDAIVKRAVSSKDEHERGARGVRRLVTILLEDALSDAILAGETEIEI